MTRRSNSLAAEAAFRARLATEGAVLLETDWLGSNSPHTIRCAAGHQATPRPHDILAGQGICKPCADEARDARLMVRNSLRTSAAEVAFRTRLAQLGATLLEPRWLGTRHPHRIRCPAGHEVSPRPFAVLGGTGVCRICAGHVWDAFYVVSARTHHRIKFGITSGDPRSRLKVHRMSGYADTVRLLTGLPGSTAPDLERHTRRTLHLADLHPVQGREYYDVSALPIVLDVVDNYPVDGP